MNACNAKRPAQSEAQLMQAIRLALGLEPRTCIFRNNVGTATMPGAQRPVAFGVGGKGGSDLVGVCDGRFIALEVKTETGRVTVEQLAFLECIRGAGGFGAIVRSVADAVAAVARCRSGEQS